MEDILVYKVNKLPNNEYSLTSEVNGITILHFSGTKQECIMMYDKNFDRVSTTKLEVMLK
jgi:hypothetical protein